MKKISRLTSVYYRNFLLLIVLPLLLLIFIVLSVMRGQTLEDADQKILLAHDNVISILTGDISNAMLKLSHFVNSSNSRALGLAKDIISAAPREQYPSTEQLQVLFDYSVAPSSDILAIHFYGTNGQNVYLRNELAISMDELRAQRFYQEALKSPNRTHVDALQTNPTYMGRFSVTSRITLAISLAPRKLDTTGTIDVVCLYMYTRVNMAIQDYSRDETLGHMCLVDGDGNLLIPPLRGHEDYMIPASVHAAEPGSYLWEMDGQTLRYTVSIVPGTDWRLVSAVDNAVLLREFNRVSYLMILITLALFLLFFAFSLLFLHNIVSPVNSLIAGMRRVEGGDLETAVDQIGQKEMRTLAHSFNSMIQKTKELMRANYEQQLAQHQAEMRALQSQINPHFLVNSLDSIRFMAMVAKYEVIKNMAEAIINVLSTSFRETVGVYALREELGVLDSYVYLMKIRYAENFDLSCDVGEDCLACQVPRLILQPIVENSIVHAFEDWPGVGQIEVSIRRRGGDLAILVSDNGRGMPPEQIARVIEGKEDTKAGIGVSNVHKRLQLRYGDRYGLSMASIPGKGTTTQILIPYETATHGITPDVGTVPRN
ncbi:MAG: sensor histidine kinase [Oscillospiraceae bacterium]|nr:sensor histidine kinase [Oscillospiraceae bacterium]